MTNNHSNSKYQTSKKYDLELRTLKFSQEIIKFLKTIQLDTINRPIISQLIRAATSVGANYAEANECNSKKDFLHKISICKKEAKETIYWLEILGSMIGSDRVVSYKQEAHEFVLIFAAILKSIKQ